ncbi:MAG TPA: hypothetical protein VFN18_13035 [Solirubrobacterales bacterium]|nr:hypothetical protein [Solirubrobacterales bacterium]
MALKPIDSISQKPESEEDRRRSLPTIPLRALEEKRSDPAVRERRERIRARIEAERSS